MRKLGKGQMFSLSVCNMHLKWRNVSDKLVGLVRLPSFQHTEEQSRDSVEKIYHRFRYSAATRVQLVSKVVISLWSIFINFLKERKLTFKF